jgi:hypothetical protein
VRQYWFNTLWVESEQAFKFSETDFYSRHENRFVVNFNTMAAEALIAMYEVTGDRDFLDRAVRVGEWLITRWNHNREKNAIDLAGRDTILSDPLSAWMPPGGFSYQFTASQREPDNYVTLYAGLSLRGLWALYRATKDERFAEIIRMQSKYILAMRDPDTRLFYHTSRKCKVERNPQFIAGAGMILLGLHEVMPLIGKAALPEETITSLIDWAYANGSCPGFTGKNDTGIPPRDGGGIVWEDTAATVNWNAQLFEYLTRLIDCPSKIRNTVCEKTITRITHRFIYIDSPTTVKIISWWPLRSWGLYYYIKRKPKAICAIYPVNLYGHLRSLVRRIAR